MKGLLATGLVAILTACSSPINQPRLNLSQPAFSTINSYHIAEIYAKQALLKCNKEAREGATSRFLKVLADKSISEQMRENTNDWLGQLTARYEDGCNWVEQYQQ